MKRASITEVKNGLSAILDRVKAGETVIITDRGIPIARIVREEALDAEGDEARLARLERKGVIRRGTGNPPVDLILTPPPKLPEPAGAVEALLEERRERW